MHLGYLFLLFTAVPFVELALLLWLASVTNPVFAFALVIVTGIVGVALARREGLQTWFRIQKELHSGQMPTQSLVDGVMILIAATLLVTPGILTDALGFTLLIPQGRALLRGAVVRYFKHRVKFQMHAAQFDPQTGETRETTVKQPSPKVIDTEFSEK